MSITEVSIAHGIGHRVVTMPGGRTLTIRPTTASDVEGLARLYQGLCSDDVYYRFFSMHLPGRSFFERQARLDESEGCGLVAVLSGEKRLVGDVGYVLLPDGGGEFALAVAGDWRGWLGPYLLDALVEVAAARGVPNLQADVLPTNHRMLALLRRRGYVRIGNGDYSVLRVAIATSESMPVWEHRRASPLIVTEFPGMRWPGELEARRAGWRVVGCSRAGSSGTGGCPALLRSQPCPLARCADAIIVGYPGDQEGAALVAAHRALHPGVPVVACPGSSDEQMKAAIDVLQSERRQTVTGGSLAGRSNLGQSGPSPDRP